MSNTSSICVATASAALLAVLAGCATAPRPEPEVTAAHTLISQAEQSDAAQFASADLEAARSKLRQADQDSHDNKPVLAVRLAQESSVDAEVAMARTRAIKAEKALQDVNAGTRSLRNETERQGDSQQPSSNVIVVPGDSSVTTTPAQR
jgi:hypothetical protein